jgi:hypothetical protein
VECLAKWSFEARISDATNKILSVKVGLIVVGKVDKMA